MKTDFNRRQFLKGAVAAGAAATVTPSSFVWAQPPAKKPWSGVFIIMQTPFLDAPGKPIDEESLARETDFLCRCGVHGMVWPAGAGETAALTFDERIKYAPTIVKAAQGRTPVLIGVHGTDKDEAIQYARYAEKIGADGMIALPPTTGKLDEPILTDYFTAIAQNSKLPLCIQVQLPDSVKEPLFTVDYLVGLAKKLPTFRYVKDEIRPVPHRMDQFVAQAKGLLTPMTGGGSRYLLNEMARGSRGTMPGAGFADIQARIWDWYEEGQKKEARGLFAKMLMMAVLELHTGYVLQEGDPAAPRRVSHHHHARRARLRTDGQGRPARTRRDLRSAAPVFPRDVAGYSAGDRRDGDATAREDTQMKRVVFALLILGLLAALALPPGSAEPVFEEERACCQGGRPFRRMARQ